MKNINREIFIPRPPLVSFIVFVNLIGWITTLGVWVYFHLAGKIPSVDSMNSYWERAYIGVVYGFTVADAVWSNIFIFGKCNRFMEDEIMGLDCSTYGQYNLDLFNDRYFCQGLPYDVYIRNFIFPVFCSFWTLLNCLFVGQAGSVLDGE